MTQTVTPRQAIAAALFLGDNEVEHLVGSDDLSGLSMRSLVTLVRVARSRGASID